jgi:hypothetical protein
MNKVGFYLFFLGAGWFLLSNASGVPQAVTKAPGEANHNSCASCHTTAGNFNTSIQLEVLNPDSMVVANYIPGQTYILRLKVSGTNNPKAYGFQMACLDSLTNSDFGVWSVLGEKVKQQNLNVSGKARKYLVQSAPKANGVFTANWKAPASDVGKIKFYFTGLAINQNGNANGDNNKFGSLTLPGPVSSLDASNTFSKGALFPNPMNDVVSVQGSQVASLRFITLSGQQTDIQCQFENRFDVSNLHPGAYFIQARSVDGSIMWTTRALKK